MDPPNNGQIGTFQLSLVKRLSSSRRSIYTQNVKLLHFCLSIIGGSTVFTDNGALNGEEAGADMEWPLNANQERMYFLQMADPDTRYISRQGSPFQSQD